MCDRCERNARERDAAETLRPPTSEVREETAREAEVRIYGPLAVSFAPPGLVLLALLLRALGTYAKAARAPSEN